MPCYNHGAYLSDAIASVLSQSDPDWELIVVDDGSSDNSLSVAKAFDDPRIRVVSQRNQGVSAARNTGLKLSQGEYVCFLDADDRFRRNRIEIAISVFEMCHGVDVVMANFSRFDQVSGATTGSQFDVVPSWKSLPLSVVDPSPTSAGSTYILQGSTVGALARLPQSLAWMHAVMLNGELARSAEFPVGVRICEDSWYLYRLFLDAVVAIVDCEVTEVRRHGANSFEDPDLSLLPELHMFQELSNEARDPVSQEGFRAGASRLRLRIAYSHRVKARPQEALAWYWRAFIGGGVGWSAVKGALATLLGR